MGSKSGREAASYVDFSDIFYVCCRNLALKACLEHSYLVVVNFIKVNIIVSKKKLINTDFTVLRLVKQKKIILLRIFNLVF